MPPEPAFILGTMFGALLILAFQAMGRRGARKAQAAMRLEQVSADEVEHMRERIAVLERLATDPAVRTSREIDALI